MSGFAASVLLAVVAALVFLVMVAHGVRRRRSGRRLWPWLVAAPVAGCFVLMLIPFTGVP